MSYYLTSNGELYHYGVKGQKWGVRRAQKKAAKAKKKWDKKVKNDWYQAYNKAANKDNSTLKEFNAKYKNVNFNDKSKAKYNRKYIEDYCKRWNDTYIKELDSMFGKSPIDDGRKWSERVPFFMDPVSEYESSINYAED